MFVAEEKPNEETLGNGRLIEKDAHNNGTEKTVQEEERTQEEESSRGQQEHIVEKDMRRYRIPI